ncbi:MAG: hypothetical protein HY437_01935 [Candidatus Magasanikbacteria bacterium]|nr:hypothetical protein [Candidatus Magasanikbacteria bacterium]
MYLRYFTLFLGAAALLFIAGSARAAEYVGGELIKIQSSDAVYYVGTDLKRYVFSGERVYKTWYDNFDTVKTVGSEELNSIPLAGVVTYRPGSRMIKIPDDPKVYVIGANGLARHIATEEIATVLYGTDWNKKIDDLAASLFIGVYTFGDGVTLTTQFDPVAARTAATSISIDKGLPVLVSTSPDAPPPAAPTSTPPTPAPTPVVLGAIEDIEIARSDSNIVYAVSGDADVGAWKTKDGGATWNRVYKGGSLTSVAVHATNPDKALIADAGKIYYTSNGGATWSVASVSSTMGAVHTVVFATVNPDRAYALSDGWLIQSLDAGVTWSAVSAATHLSFTFLDVLVTHPLDDTTVYAGSTLGLQRSTDGGLSWTNLKPPVSATTLNIRSIAPNPLDPFIYYTTTDQGFWYTADNASSWNATRVPGVVDNELYDVAVSKNDTNIVYVATKKGVFRSINRAVAWELVTGNMGLSDTKTLTVDPKNENRVLAGTRDQGSGTVDGEGLYVTADGGVKWEKQQVFITN